MSGILAQARRLMEALKPAMQIPHDFEEREVRRRIGHKNLRVVGSVALLYFDPSDMVEGRMPIKPPVITKSDLMLARHIERSWAPLRVFSSDQAEMVARAIAEGIAAGRKQGLELANAQSDCPSVGGNNAKHDTGLSYQPRSMSETNTTENSKRSSESD
jgi:hypothetical protein